MIQLNNLRIWKELEKKAIHTQQHDLLNGNFNQDLSGAIIQTPQISLNYQHQRINQDELDLLFQLANELYLADYIDALFSGNIVNQSERKPALHTALRSFKQEALMIDGTDIMPNIMATREQIKFITDSLRSEKWLGYTGKPITDIVNVGIGGSDFGPRFCIAALSDYVTSAFNYHFISDADFKSFNHILSGLNPETTLFIIASKSFKTYETLYNTKKILAWIGHPENYRQHVIAVTANAENAEALKISNILPIWNWIGGRYSTCSAINLITAIAIGAEQFEELLKGANSLDNHFQQTPFEKNLPVVLALLGIWNNNFLNIHNLLTLIYAQQLEGLIPFIQQLDMESNGKSIDNAGQTTQYATGPILWGGLGNQAQHSYYQLLYQGTHKIAVDFISVTEYDNELINKICYTNQRMLEQNMSDNPYRFTPFNHLKLTRCSPRAIGALIALYEHKVYAQACIWNINPFDQPGVERAKRVNGIHSF